MAYENVKFNRDNLAVYNGSFYMFDEYKDVLVQKTAGGSTSFQYPVNIGNNFTNFTNLSSIKCLQYDGYSFWTLQRFTDNSGFIIRRWLIDNFVCDLIKQYVFANTSDFTYDSNTFSLEYYSTYLSNDYSKNSNIITIDEFTDYSVYPGTVIGVGPNKYGDKEFVIVDYVDGSNIYLDLPLSKTYYKHDPITITTSLLIFNNYGINKSDTGSLLMVDAESGIVLSVVENIEYRYITASKYVRLKNIVPRYDDIHSLVYIKGTNAKLRNLGDLHRYRAQIKASDDFDLPDDSLPDEENWEIISGDPIIKGNKLFCSTYGTGEDEIKSTYRTVGDFQLTVSGSIGGSQYFFSNESFYRHYLGISDIKGTSYFISRSVKRFYRDSLINYNFNSLLDYTLEDPPLSPHPPEQTCYFTNPMDNITTITGTYTTVISGVSTIHYLAYTDLEANICGVFPLVSGTVGNKGTNGINGHVVGTNVVSGTNGNALWFDGISDKVELKDFTLGRGILFYDDFEGTQWQWSFNNAWISSYAGFYSSGSHSVITRGSGGRIESKYLPNIVYFSDLYVYAWVRQSDNNIYNGPESGDDFFIQYYNSSGSWITLRRLYGSDPYGTQYNIKEKLPDDAYHNRFRIRFYNGSSYSSGDAWFVDDIYIAPADFNLDNSNLSLYFKINPTLLENHSNIYGISHVLYDDTCQIDNNILFMDDFTSSSNWSFYRATFVQSYYAKYCTNVVRLYGNEYSITMVNAIDLSNFSGILRLFVSTVNIDAESSDYVRVEYYNSSGSWVEVGRIYGGSYYKVFRELYFTLGSDAYHSDFKLRFREYSNCTDCDTFYINDVILYDGTNGDINYQPRPSLCVGISDSGNVVVYGNKLDIRNTKFRYELGNSDIEINNWYDIIVTLSNTELIVKINDSTYSQSISNIILNNYTYDDTNLSYSKLSNFNYIGKLENFYYFDYALSDDEYNLIITNKVEYDKLSVSINSYDYYDVINTNYDLDHYMFRLTRQDNILYFEYYDSGWIELYNTTLAEPELNIYLGLYSKLTSVYESYWDDYFFENGYIRYPNVGDLYFGIMNIDNLQSDGSTVIPIYDIDIENDNLYRLQNKAMYYDNDYSWSTYNYQISPMRSFIDFITVDASPHILPATGRNVAMVTSITLDQYGLGVINKPVTFTDDDPVGFMTREVVYTDVFNYTGKASSIYKSGVDLRIVTIKAEVTQYD